jgi:hypothetical protein
LTGRATLFGRYVRRRQDEKNEGKGTQAMPVHSDLMHSSSSMPTDTLRL